MRASAVLTSDRRARHDSQLLTDRTGADPSAPPSRRSILNPLRRAARRREPAASLEVVRSLSDACRRPAVYIQQQKERVWNHRRRRRLSEFFHRRPCCDAICNSVPPRRIWLCFLAVTSAAAAIPRVLE